MLLSESSQFQLQQIILSIGDEYEIRVVVTSGGVAAAIGALLGLALGGVRGAVAGVTLGAAVGAGGAILLREAWDKISQVSHQLIYIVYNYLRNLDINDWTRAAIYVMDCAVNRRRIAEIIISFLKDNFLNPNSSRLLM